MEGLRKRAIVAVAVLLAAGAAIAFTKKPVGDPKTEDWMLKNTPQQFAGYTMLGGAESPLYTYKMDDITYKTLEPYGIVARLYENLEKRQSFDVVIIASRSKDSFHDPRVCFSAQGWALANQWLDTIPTKTRGNVPVTITLMDGPDGRNKVAAFIYKGPGGFYGNTQRLKTAMFIETFTGGTDLDGVFYRFIPNYEIKDQTQLTRELKAFIAEYLDAANAASDGYF
jgi:hypothetical protein